MSEDSTPQVINSEMSLDTKDFLTSLCNDTYKDDEYVRRAIGSVALHPDVYIIEERANALFIYLNEWYDSNKNTQELRPPSEAVIACLVGNDLREVGDTKFVENFGKESHKTATDLYIDFSHTPPEELRKYISNKPPHIAHIIMITLTETLLDIYTNIEDYDICACEVNDCINAGFIVKTKGTPNLNIMFDALAFELMNPVFTANQKPEHRKFVPKKKYVL